MFKFATYKVGGDPTGGWRWQVTQSLPQASLIVIVAAQSGHAYVTEQAAIDNYNAFVKWAANPSSPADEEETNAN